MKGKYAIFAGVVALALLLVFTNNLASQRPAVQDTKTVGIIDQAGDLSFKLIDGRRVSLKELLSDGKPLVIYFFATWCPTCRADMRNLNAAYSKFSDEINVLVVGFDPTETISQLKEFKTKNGYDWLFADYNKEAIIKFKIVAQASKVGLSPKGEVVFSRGYSVLPLEEWVSLLSELASSA